MYIAAAIIIFGLLVMIHEFGHFTACRIFRVRVNEFSLGMGPAIFKKQGKETLFALRCLPFGGYCAIEGEDGVSTEPGSLALASLWKKLIVLAAGAAMNFIAGFVIVAITLSFSAGYPTLNVVGFMDEAVAEETGVMEGDRIVSLDGHCVNLFSEFRLFASRADNPAGVEMEVVRNGERVKLGLVPLALREFEENGETVQRYGFYFAVEPRSLGSVLRQSAYNCGFFVRLVWMGLSDLVHGRVAARDMSGAVGMVAALSEAGERAESAGEGLLNVFFLGAFIAVNLAVMNMLPIPGLDGGHVFTMVVSAALAKLLRRKLDPKVENYIHAAGLVLLLGFMLFLTGSDILKLIFG